MSKFRDDDNSLPSKDYLTIIYPWKGTMCTSESFRTDRIILCSILGRGFAKKTIFQYAHPKMIE